MELLCQKSDSLTEIQRQSRMFPDSAKARFTDFKGPGFLKTEVYMPLLINGSVRREKLRVWSYHYVEDVLVLGLMVQPFGSVEYARVGVHPELPHADGVNAAVDGVAQLMLLISVCGLNLQYLCIRKHILRNCHIIMWLGEFRAIIVIIQHFDKYL